MRRWSWLVVFVAWSWSCAACGAPAMDEGTGGPASVTMPTEAATGGAVAATAARTSEAPAGPTRTMDPTREAFYKAFELPVHGDPDAPVTIYEFSDYLCPFCRKYALETAAGIEADYVRTGKVKIVFYDYPIPAHGLPAVISHEAAHCAGEQDRYWEMYAAIFARQDEIAGLAPQDEDAARALLVTIGLDAGVDRDALAACLEDARYRPVLVGLADAAQAKGVSMTPTLIVAGASGQEVVPGYVSFDDLKPYVERALGGGTPTGGAE